MHVLIAVASKIISLMSLTREANRISTQRALLLRGNLKLQYCTVVSHCTVIKH